MTQLGRSGFCGNIRAAKIVGLSVGKLILTICFLAGAAAGLAGMVEVAAVQGRTNANLAAGYGFTGIFFRELLCVAFLIMWHAHQLIYDLGSRLNDDVAHVQRH